MITPIAESLFKTIEEPYYSVNIECKIKNQQGLYEDVSDLNGLVIPSIFEMKHTNKLTLYQRITLGSRFDPYLSSAINQITYPCQTISDYLYLTNVYQAVRDNVHYRISQINEFDWLTNEMVEKCHEHISKYISFKTPITYEKFLGYVDPHERYGQLEFHGRLDAVDDENIWEFKCVESLQIEHLIQLVIYAWMWEKAGNSKRDFFIMNIRTGDTRQLETSQFQQIDQIVQFLLKNKYDKIHELSDQQLIEECKKQTEYFKNWGETPHTPLSPPHTLNPPHTQSPQSVPIPIPIPSKKNKYSHMKIKELHQICKERKITGYCKKKKNEIIDLLIYHDSQSTCKL
jgi:hypothetical protein